MIIYRYYPSDSNSIIIIIKSGDGPAQQGRQKIIIYCNNKYNIICIGTKYYIIF